MLERKDEQHRAVAYQPATGNRTRCVPIVVSAEKPLRVDPTPSIARSAERANCARTLREFTWSSAGDPRHPLIPYDEPSSIGPGSRTWPTPANEEPLGHGSS